LVAVRWQRAEDQIQLALTVPVNAYATVAAPRGYAIRSVRSTDRDGWEKHWSDGVHTCDLGSGHYAVIMMERASGGDSDSNSQSRA
jgi:uncharacterized protein YjlB